MQRHACNSAEFGGPRLKAVSSVICGPVRVFYSLQQHAKQHSLGSVAMDDMFKSPLSLPLAAKAYSADFCEQRLIQALLTRF